MEETNRQSTVDQKSSMITDMNDKTVLITGATGGIGRVTAHRLAKLGARVLIVGRDEEKAIQTASEIRQQSGNPQVEYLLADLSEMDQVRRLAAEVGQRTDRLDVLINNAGAFFARRELTREGLECTFALNHLAYFLLTQLLLNLLHRSGPARIVNVSSAAHRGARLDMNDLQVSKGYNGLKAYSRSKLMNLYFTYELARRLKGSGVTANAVHPGFVATNIGRANGGWVGGLLRVARVAAITPEQGAEALVHLSASPDLEGVSGKYFEQQRLARSSEVSYDDEIALRLWDRSLQLAGLPEEQPQLVS